MLNNLVYPLSLGLLLTVSCAQPNGTQAQENRSGRNTLSVAQASVKQYPVTKTEAEWRAQLSPEQYHVLRQKGTERAFSGKYNKHQEKGIYTCAACGTELFSSETKFDSKTGWPSFYAPLNRENVEEVQDRSHGMVRTEVVCSQCGGHLGHVFDDGPKPTGLRYCLNSLALGFKKE
ncbi:hypothetical protein BH24BAC1_BH24BAC1_04210 [soil metagenome]